jgi:twitching motility protein PilT
VPRLDRFIEVLFLRDADALILESGSPAWLEGGEGGGAPIMQRKLTTEHIVSAIAELLPPYAAQGFSGTDPEQFEYAAPAGHVEIVFMPSAAGVRAELRVLGRHPGATHAVRAVESAPAEAVRLAPREAPPAAVRHSVDAEPGRCAEAMRLLLDLCQTRGASDLHLTSGAPPAMRIDGDVRPLDDWSAVSAETLQQMLFSITPERNREQWLATKDSDFAHETDDARFRVNLFCDRSGIAAVLRRIPGKVHSAEEMGIPKELLDLCFLPKGLILVTGPTGSGKSTTLAAMIDFINQNRDDHIITIEDPIEFVHRPKRCLIRQREVGVHTQSFKAALRAALREDPNVVLVGEMRDLETISIAIETAETGHLVFGTLHTNTAPSTVDRIIDQFPADRQGQVRTMLSESLKAVVTQTLCKKAGGGRVAAREVLVANGAVSNLIREGKTFQLASIMQTGRAQGMHTLNDALLDLVRKGLVDPAEALAKSVARAELRKALDALARDGGPVSAQTA